MDNKINIAELLEDCPRGMELYSPIFGEVYLDKIRPHLAIVVTIDKEQGDCKEEFLYDGRYEMKGECMIFPSKAQRDWSKFHRPFKDGDIVALGFDETAQIFIFKEYIRAKNNYARCYMMLDNNGEIDFEVGSYYLGRFATEEEKQKLFNAINENGFKWNAETKTLEKVEPEFKDGDILATDLGSVFYLNTRLNTDEYYGCYVGIGGDGSFHICEPFAYKECCGLASEEEKEKLFQAIKDNGYEWNAETKTPERLIEPKFKVGDRIVEKKRNVRGEIIYVQQDKYCVQLDNNDGLYVYFRDQDDWELVPDKFDNPLLGALTTFGPSHQRMMCIEECAELVDALAKYDRGRVYAKDVITELADVCIMVEQMAMLFGKKEFEKEKERKLKRLQEKIDEASNL